MTHPPDKAPTRYIATGFGVFELRDNRKPVLWCEGKQKDHDYKRDEILAYASSGDWREVDAAEGKRLIEEQAK